MSNLPLDDKLKQLFDDITNGRSTEDPPRAILVQNDNGVIRLMNSASSQGSDRDDFNDVLGKLFSNEPNKPGYALYRLDSKSPAGLYEWINCAFRPEGAKVREKMQYSITQASLFKGLNEQHFLDTVYGATVHEFSFPSRLRNSRKHDYQNPQLSTRGKSAAEAAGTDAGGKRRIFESLTAAAAVGGTANESNLQSSNAPTKLVATMPEVASSVQATPKAADTPPAEQRESKLEQEIPSVNKEFKEPIKNEDPMPVKSNEEVKSAETESEAIPTQEESQPEIEKDVPPVSTKEEVAEEETEPAIVEPEKKDEIQFISEQPSANISEPVAHKITAHEPESKVDILPEPSTVSSVKEEELKPAPEASAISKPAEEEQKKVEPITSTNATTQSTTSSIGLGRGAAGLETEREKELAKLKLDETQTRASGSAQQGTGGPKTGFAWDSNVEEAIQKLGKSSTTANLVVLKLDLSKEEVQLAGEPEFVEPSGLAKAISFSAAKTGSSSEPNYVFYSHPDLQQSSESQESQIALIYVCPTNSTVRQRMLYSVNLAILSNRVNEIEGVKIAKRTETSDVEDLTPEFLADALSLNGAEGTQQNGANSFTRPKRPGRR